MINIYGNEKFSPEMAKKHVETLINNFRSYYSKLGYEEEPSVLISSGIDPTVRFIGSHISVLKPYLINDSVPSPGIYMHQNCIRTRNVKYLLEDDYFSSWGSYFPSIGVLFPSEKLNESLKNFFHFLVDELKISPQNILIRINSKDSDLLDACEYCGFLTEIDSKNPEYYQHKIGLQGIWGRSCNIALKNTFDNDFSDVGNIIVIENEVKKLGIEIALGSTMILKQLYGLEHVQDCTPVLGFNSENNIFRRKFEDSIITSVFLFREGLKPFERNSRSKILKQYLLSLSYFRAKLGLSIDRLFEIIFSFEKREFPESIQCVSRIIIKSLREVEKDIISKKNLTEKEAKIKKALNSF